MKKLIFINIILCFIISNGLAQTKTTAKTPTITAKTTTITPKKGKEKQYTRWSIKTGINLSVIYLARNVKENNNEPGYCAGITYELNDFLRLATLHSSFAPIDIEPTWYGIKATSSELNLEFIAKFPNKKTWLYPFTGFSYNTYKGFFTGRNDYLNLREKYGTNTTIKNNWLGLNVGLGLEHNFNILGVFIDYRMRVGRQERVFNIMDVCYTGGVKIRFPYGKLAKSIAHMNDRFYWF